MKLCLVIGTRPEIIKMSPLTRQCLRLGIDFFVVETGQHYDYNLNELFFRELQLPSPKYNLSVGSGSFSNQVGRMMVRLEHVLVKERPSHVLAEGDTNTVLAAALVSSHLNISFVHVEAGLRSGNWLMQEEKTRIIADRIADILFPPTDLCLDVLVREGVASEKVYVTGNTIVDALLHYLPMAEQKSHLEKFGLEPRQYFLATVHRAENVDFREPIQRILQAFQLISEEYGLPVIFPTHPRTRARINEFGIMSHKGVQFIEPVGFFDFLVLEKNTALVLTDSGGVQEECCVLQIPCLTLREHTERPETVHVGANILVGSSAEKLLAGARWILGQPRNWANPFGDGHAAERMIDILNQRPRFPVGVDK